MIDIGDIHLADVKDERRHEVLVVSNARFHELWDRVLVAPAIETVPDEMLFPWHVRVDQRWFAIDQLRSLPISRLLERIDRASAPAMSAVRRVLLSIT
jgi:mRNA-degrading endonuclease toxin of MazEF toxin-antitoxin module